MSSRPEWRELSEDSDTSENRMAMVEALEEMANQAQAQEDADFTDSEYDDDDDDDDYEDAEDEDDEEFDVEDTQVIGEVDLDDEDEIDLEDDNEDEEDEAGDDDDGESEEHVGISELIRSALAPRSGPGTEADQEGQSRTAQAIRGIGIAGLRQLLAQGGFTLRTSRHGEEEEDEDNWYGSTRSSNMGTFWEPIKEPVKAGQELLLSGEFGKTPKRPLDSDASAFEEGRNLVDRLQRRKTSLGRVHKTEMDDRVPNTSGTEVARYPARVYCGQYSQDSSFFYTCTQDFRVQMYDTTVTPSRRILRLDDAPNAPRRTSFYTSFGTTQYTSLKPIKTIQGRAGNWTITDANLSPDNQWMIYSSITPVVHLVSTKAESQGGQDLSDRQVPLDFDAGSEDDGGVRYRSGIWSIRFSGDSREIVAGAHFGDIYVYDIEARRRVLRVEGHRDDVNGVTFADSASSNVLISGSDDSYVKVWDRRSLAGGKPAGVLAGHTEGVTYVAPKGDGRYCISNGKDQSMKLWDLRNMKSSEEYETFSRRTYGLRNWDYRNMYYRKPRYPSHPDDCSVMTYRGHAVLKTLIRCHFSPAATTGQKYVYSGSADGRIHIWSLDGNIVGVLDRSKARDIFAQGEVDASDASAPERNDGSQSRSGRTEAAPSTAGFSRSWSYESKPNVTVRDVSWHSSESSIMSTAWDGPDNQRGSIAKHEWMGYGKGTSLEDAFARTEAEANEMG